MRVDPYEVLGVEPSASAEDVKRAYRRLARELHPDRNRQEGAEERFKDVQAAYEVLGDPARRREHDEQRQAPPVAGPWPGGMWSAEGVPDWSDLFGARVHVQTPLRPQPSRSRGAHRSARTSISFEQAHRGAEVVVPIDRDERCGTCEGSGASGPAGPEPCPWCEGSGVDARGPVPTPCPLCGGSGLQGAPPCPTCEGRGVVPRSRRYRVRIPAGVSDGARIRLPGRGDEGTTGTPGDLYVTVEVEPHPYWERRGDDIETVVPVTLVEAVNGGEVEVPGLDGPRRIRLRPGTRPGTRHRLRGQGMARTGDEQARGDAYYRIEVDVPAVDEEVAQALEALRDRLPDPRAGRWEEQ